MTWLSLQKRMEFLEEFMDNDPVYLQEQADRRQREQRQQNLRDLFHAFPDSLRKEFLLKLKSRHPKYKGLHDLLICMSNGIYEPSTFPEAVAEVYLHDPDASPWLRCQDCRVLLPSRSGFWIHDEKPSFWQGCLHYFDKCPGCQGLIIHRGTEEPLVISNYLPLRPEPPWHFVDSVPESHLRS